MPSVGVTPVGRRIATPAIVVPDPATLPAELLALKRGLLWRLAPAKKAGGKPRKIPYYVGGGVRKGPLNSAEDRARWVTVADVVEAAQRSNAGVGVAICDDDEAITCIDLETASRPTVRSTETPSNAPCLMLPSRRVRSLSCRPAETVCTSGAAPRTGPTARLSRRGWRYSPPPARTITGKRWGAANPFGPQKLVDITSAVDLAEQALVVTRADASTTSPATLVIDGDLDRAATLHQVDAAHRLPRWPRAGRLAGRVRHRIRQSGSTPASR